MAKLLDIELFREKSFALRKMHDNELITDSEYTTYMIRLIGVEKQQ